MEYILKEGIIIDDVEDAVSRIRDLSGCEDVTMDKIADFAKNEANTMFYIDEYLRSSTELNQNKRFMYMWIDTGYVSENYNSPIFISLIKSRDCYAGHFIGDARCLSHVIQKHFPSNSSEVSKNLLIFNTKYKTKVDKRTLRHINSDNETIPVLENINTSFQDKFSVLRHDLKNLPEGQEIEEYTEELYVNEDVEFPKKFTEVTESVWERLLIKHWDSIEGLDYYLKICGCRVYELIKEEKNQYYIINNIKSVVVNTGLFNQFGQDILVLYQYYAKTDSYYAHLVIESKSDLIATNFDREQISKNIEPISFYDSEDVFDAKSIDDFDINYRSLIHILRERKYRFPDLPEQVLAEKLKNAISLGITITHRDRSFVKASYGSKQKGVAWILPLHVEREFSDEPELVMMIIKKNDFYEVKTILPYSDDIKKKIVSLSLYSKVW